MGEIRILDKSVAEKIAAGEVVERPASIVKELVENSLDAGSTAITVEIEHGGTSYIRVTDNGRGMDADDCRLAFMRHATSKIKGEADLEHIMTLGFRGEALCSIGAVSHTDLLTRRRGSDAGHIVCVHGGEIVKDEEAGCPEGTTVIVRDLFFNTPARMKFLKRDATEGSYVYDVCQKQALGRPDISIRFIRDGKEVFYTPGDNRLGSAVHATLGKDFAREMLEVNYSASGITVTGLTGKNVLSRPNRAMEFFFVNSRTVVNKTLYVALGEAYKNELMGGRFPIAVLDVTIDPSQIDVNVHPSKTEVKFVNENAIYEAVYWAVKNALKSGSAPREAELPKRIFKTPVRESTVEQITIDTAKTETAPPRSFSPYKPEIPVQASVKENTASERRPEYKTTPKNDEPQPEITAPEKAKYDDKPFEPLRVIGQLFLTYILAQRGDEFLLIDQHAAHERINYEKLKSRRDEVLPQMLLSPISVGFSGAEYSTAIENIDFLRSIGLECEEFGENTLLLRSVPSDVDASDAAALLTETLAVLSHDGAGEVSARRDRALYTVACKSAIRANLRLSIEEAQSLAEEALALEGISTCPHGRPISISITKREIEKMFKRIV